MLCPVCRNPQIIVEFSGVEVDACCQGHGLWVDAQELSQLFGSRGGVDPRDDWFGHLEARPGGATRRARPCPRCQRPLQEVCTPGEPQAVVLDRCPQGHGIWFDDGELETFLALTPQPSAQSRVLRDFLGAYAQDVQTAKSQGVGPEMEIGS